MSLSKLRGLAALGVATVVVALVGSGVSPAKAAPSGSPVGTLAGGVTFSQECGGSDIGVGITYDGANLWYSCYNTPTDLYRADPAPGR